MVDRFLTAKAVIPSPHRHRNIQTTFFVKNIFVGLYIGLPVIKQFLTDFQVLSSVSDAVPFGWHSDRAK